MDHPDSQSHQPHQPSDPHPAAAEAFSVSPPTIPAYNPQDYAQAPSHQQPQQAPADERLHPLTATGAENPPPLPPRRSADYQDESSPIYFSRDPKRLTAYLVPFPKPANTTVVADQYPPRFLIYTPPAPPLSKPAEGEKEGKVRKVQRKWQEEVRAAKTSPAKTMSWKGIRAGATKGISNLMGKTTSSSIDFLGRVQTDAKPDGHAEDGIEEGATTSKTVGLEEMALLYPPSLPGSPETIRAEFIDSMMRTKTKAQRDAIIATGLLPVAEAIDILATFVWPFGGLMEIDAVWAYGNIRGAKTARSVTKRLTSSGTGDHQKEQLRLNFTPSPRLEILERYLIAKCHERDPKRFPSGSIAPTDTDVLEAIGWNPSQVGGETHNWEDEQWELSEVKEDLRNVMGKGAKEWVNWCKAFEKDPEKAVKK
jgi:hypothetical protein